MSDVKARQMLPNLVVRLQVALLQFYRRTVVYLEVLVKISDSTLPRGVAECRKAAI